MSDNRFWSRLKKARLLQLLALYLGGSWIVLQVVALFVENLGLPEWATPAAVALLLVGLLVVVATAWVQSHPLAARRAETEEMPGRWELELAEMREALSRGEVPHLTWARAALGGVLAFSLLFGFAGLYVVLQDRGRSFTPEPAVAAEADPGVAVLPFSVQGESLDREVWSEGMVSLVSFGLDGAAGLRAIDRSTVLARWHERVGERGDVDLATALGLARDVGAAHAVVGSAVSVGSDVRLVADVYDVGTGDRVGQSQAEGSPDSVQTLVDRLTVKVLSSLLGEQAETLRVDLARTTTRSLPALKSYLEGEAAYRRSDFDAAVAAFEEAVATDSTFALAHARLASAAGWADVGHPVVPKHRKMALRYGDRLPERIRRLLWAWEEGWSERNLAAVDTLRRLSRQYPDDPRIWYQYADAFVHLNVGKEPAEVVDLFRHAVDLDPTFAPYWIHYLEGHFFLYSDDSARVTEEVERFYRTAAPASLLRRKFDIALGLAYGSPETRERTVAALDTVPWRVAQRVPVALSDPRHWPARERLLRSLADRSGRDAREYGRTQLFDLAVDRGRWREALERARDPAMNPFVLACELPFLRWRGALPGDAPIEPLVERGVARLPPPPDGPGCRYVLPALEGRWDEFERGLKRLRRQLRERSETSDEPVAVEDTSLRVWDGMGAWLRGDPERALRIFTGGKNLKGNLPGWWFGELYRALGRYREAEEAFLVEEFDPLNRLALAEVRERMGKRREALEDYRYFVLAWRDAEPELQPKVERARRRVAALEEELGVAGEGGTSGADGSTRDGP